MKNQTHYIYSLTCPIDGQVKYIGCSVNVEQRLSAHLSSFEGSIDKIKWCRELVSKKLKPIVSIVASTSSKVKSKVLEEKYIVKYSKDGHTLFNSKMNPSRPNPRLGRTVEEYKKLQRLANKKQCSIYELPEYKQPQSSFTHSKKV